MFLTHDGRHPFFGGTYFPKEPRYGMPAFTDLIQKVAAYYEQHRDDIAKQNAALMEVFRETLPPPTDSGISAKPLEQARAQLIEQFDREFGGFGGAPKFPHATTLEVLLRRWRASAHETQPDLQALFMTTLTLTRMAEGGIYDQLGGGFSRYAVDQYWMIPHFEKMLYDNGPLLALYAQAAIATGDTLFERIARETANWMLREMQSREGGFWSTLDADSEGHEGQFYVWTPDQVRAALNADEFVVFAARFGLDSAPNFEGAWHLHGYQSLDAIAQKTHIAAPQAEALLNSARNKLLIIRNARVWPGRDEKILTAWNALAIKGLAIAARALDSQELAAAAMRAVDFIHTELWREGRLLAVYKNGRARFAAYLDDYAFMLEALLELLQVRWRTSDLHFAIEIAEVLLAHFEDPTAGGFFFTADDAEQLIHRSKTFGDESVPAGNGTAACVLNRLGHIVGNARYLKSAERTLQAAWSSLERYPAGHASLLMALEDVLIPLQLIVIRGVAGEISIWQRELNKLYAPRTLVLAIPSSTVDLPQALADKKPMQETVGYVCRGEVCSEPLKSLAALLSVARE